jgi:hypothetical protein
MVSGNGTTLPKTFPNSYRVFVPAAMGLRLRWMSPGAVLSIAPDIALFIGGDCQAAFATGLDGPSGAFVDQIARPVDER